ncbi:MAG: hypothetical protein HPY53_01500 [Brevinematales bacterium]|nr:hypothetical protein [Brevinematales bacterium]
MKVQEIIEEYGNVKKAYEEIEMKTIEELTKVFKEKGVRYITLDDVCIDSEADEDGLTPARFIALHTDPTGIFKDEVLWLIYDDDFSGDTVPKMLISFPSAELDNIICGLTDEALNEEQEEDIVKTIDGYFRDTWPEFYKKNA